mgnify:CR=1 FL=1
MTFLSAAQMNSQNDIEANFTVIESLIRQSKAQGASLIVFPENFACFAAGKQRETAAQFEAIQQRLEQLAHQHQIWIVAGTLPCPFRPDGSVIQDGRVRTASLCISPEKTEARYDKIHLFDVQVGDAVGGYAPIKDLLKTRVWEISRWRNKAAAAGVGIGGLRIVGNENGDAGTPLPGGVMIPVSSIEKAPSAELRPGQKDSDSLPEYALLDQVLAMYIEHAHGRADLLADGFDEATVDTVMRLVDRAEWKRRQYPLGPKVTALAFGRDRRLPVTNAFRE